jgi:parallel beta-helix repeat protein
MGDSLTIRNCKVSDTSTEGIYIVASSDVLLEKNIITRNNIERITGYYPAAVKIFNQSHRVTCNDNLVIDHPYSSGIWYDVGNVDGLFTNNWLENIGNNKSYFDMKKPYPSGNAFFFEISKGAVCANNVFVNCDHGVWVLNSSNVLIYNNTFVNSTACISRDTRGSAADHFGWHPTTGPGVDERFGHEFVNNLLVGDEEFGRLLLYTKQSASLCNELTEPQFNQMDYNVYVRMPGMSHQPLMSWSPVKNNECYQYFNAPDEVTRLIQDFSSNSKYFPDYSGPLFKSKELGNFELLGSFPTGNAGKELPDNISRMLGGKHGNYIGAYPPAD